MNIQSVLKQRLVVATPDETVAVAAKRMAEHRIGALLVVKDQRLVGIFSERDIVNRVVAEGRDPKTTPVHEVATKDPVTVPENAKVGECYDILKNRGFRHLPVVNDAGQVVGMISQRDFVEFMVLSLERQHDMSHLFKDVWRLQLNIYGG